MHTVVVKNATTVLCNKVPPLIWYYKWTHLTNQSICTSYLSLFPRPPHPAFVTCSTKSGGKAWTDLSRDACCCCHIQSAHIWVCSLPFTLLSLDSVRSFCSVCPASPVATGSIVASYSMWCQQQHASRDKFVQAFSPLFVPQATKAGCGGLGMRLELPSVKGLAGLFQLNVVNSVAVRKHVFFKMLFHPAREWSGIHGTPRLCSCACYQSLP